MPVVTDKAHPSPAWIAALQRQFPCEPAVEGFLTRKLSRRAGAGYEPLSLGALCAGVEALLRAALETPFEITQPRWLTGGASKLQMAFQLRWQPPGEASTTSSMVLRMQPAESIVESSRLREFQLLRAFAGQIPVPPVFWVDPEGEHLPYPGLVYGLMEGMTKPTHGVGGAVSGMGTNYGERLRPLLSSQFVEQLARIHTLDWREAELGAFEIPAPGTQAVERQINWWARVWAEDAQADLPLIAFAEMWLRARMPHVSRISILHGDYRCGNFLFDEASGQITAWLDWELGHLGDRHEDLAWSTNLTWGHPIAPGGRNLVCGLMFEEDFLEAYERASGLSVDAQTLRYFKVLNTWKTAVMALATGYRAAKGGKTHQDVLVAWCIGVGSKFAEELNALLEELA